MTTAPAATLGRVEQPRPLVSPVGWCWIAALAVLFIVVHSTYLERLFRIVTQAGGDNIFELLLSALRSSWNPDWSHALIVPLFSIFYIYLHRRDLARSNPRVWFPALPLMFLGLVSYVFWIFPGRNDMFQGYSMLLTLFALVLFLLGPGPMRILWFPIAFLGFGVKIADSLWDRIAWELQQIASAGAVYALKFFTAFLDFDVVRQGTTLELIFVRGGVPVHEKLNVAEACSGLRSLMAFVALGAALAFVWERPWWQRLVIIAMTVPIAVGVNIARVTILGLLFLVDPKYAHGDFHTMIGMLMLIPAGGLFLLLGWIMDRIIIRDDEAGPAGRTREPAPAAEPDADRDPRPAPAGETPAEQVLGATAVAFLIGVVAMAAAAGVYWLAFVTGAPGQDLPLLLSMASLMVWLTLPAALVGAGLCLLGWKLVWPMVQRIARRGRFPVARLVATGMVAGVLVTLGAGQRAVVDAFDVVLIKKPVPLRDPLVMLPVEVGKWQRYREDPPLPREQVQELGTDQYISRIYHDTTWPKSEPGGYIRLHVAYYTGTTDTVPHVPDRCFVAGGAQGFDKGATTISLTGDYRRDRENGGHLAQVQPRERHGPPLTARLPQTQFDATYFTFAAPTGPGQPAAADGRMENVIYFFAANGKYLATPDGVRARGFDTQDRYSYYCKVEVQIIGVADKDQATARASDFLSTMLPEVMACLPDWVEVTEGRWPREANE